jgi:hypothetical protein
VFAQFVTCELTKNKIPFAVNSDRNNYAWDATLKPVLDAIVGTNCV